MYIILGGDGKEYGPVPAATLRQWVAQGRVHNQTQVQAEGSTAWKPLSAYPELVAETAGTDPLPSIAGSGTAAAPVKTSGMAVWSLGLGVSSFLCGITAIPGIILGFMAMRDIKSSQGRLGGNGMALAGIITSGVVMLLIIPIAILSAMLLPALAKAKSKAQTINCVNNMKQLALGVRIFSGDNQDTFPAATNWCDALQTTVGSPKVFRCPADLAQPSCSYTYNANLSGIAERDVAPDTVLFFESNLGWNGSGGAEALTTPSRHGQTYVIAFADGSVQQLRAERLSGLRWSPK